MKNNKPSWKERFKSKYYYDFTTQNKYLEVLDFVRQTIKEEREETIKEVLNEVWKSSIDEEEFNKIKLKLYDNLA